ncbi:MAG: LTA synthase family protein [Bacteroidales bacterium]|nr:LTA synthase family protein [Bacteroidales bacterium]
MKDTMSYYTNRNKNKNRLTLPVFKLLIRLSVVLLLFSLSRWLIYLFNLDFFNHLSLGESLRLYLSGMRFDLVVIAYANIPVILYYCLPCKFIYNKVLHKIIDIYYVMANSVIVLFNMIDVIYFRFIGKRMTSEFFQFFGNSDENIGPILGQVIVDYWYMLVLCLLFVLVLIVVANRTKLRQQTQVVTNRWYFFQWMSLLVFSALTPIACRGGLQAKPVNMMTALKYADSHNVPIVLNTPFTIVKSSTSKALQEVHLFDEDEMEFTPIHYSLEANRFIADTLDYTPNLVYIILESFGQEMITYYNPERRYHLTPFLDSLLEQSLTFDGRANGRRSIEALPSLLSGIPSLMEVDFTSSPYFSNQVDGIGTTLKPLGYHTSMFHGGNNGTMNFDVYAHNAGFDSYYGRNEYGNDDDFDGRWGIFDGPFLQYSLQTMSSFPKPFATVVYTLSSHHPYTLPEDFTLPKDAYLWSGFEKTVYYSDCALRDFFEEASTQPWYDSTLFVITADHANTEHYMAQYSNLWGMYAIPIAFFMPSRIPAMKTDEMVQQSDLNLSILSALGVNDTVFSFGRNVFDTLTEPSFVAYLNQTYQYSDGRYLIQSDGTNTIGVFNIQRDPNLDENLVDHIQCEDLSLKLKERIQEYNNRHIFNQIHIDKEALHEQKEDTIHHQPNLGQDPQGASTTANQ